MLVEYTDNLERNLCGIQYPTLRDMEMYVLPMQLALRQLLKASSGTNVPETYDHNDQLILPFELMDHPPASQTQDQVIAIASGRASGALVRIL